MAQQPEGRTCANCLYGIEDSGYVCCQLNPPAVGVRLHSTRAHAFPAVAPDWWCGYHAPADPETATEAAATLARLVLVGDLTAARLLVDKIKEDGA